MNIISEEETVRKRTANTKRIIRVDIGLVSCIRHGVVSQEVIKKTTVCLAQLVERTAFNRMVAGSSPAMGTRILSRAVKGGRLKIYCFGFVGSNPTECTSSYSSVGRAPCL
jgi:hypothetical protein